MPPAWRHRDLNRNRQPAPWAVGVERIGGLDLYYLEQGTGPEIVLVHGWPTSSRLWEGVIPLLAGAGRVLAPDLPGFGSSDKPLDLAYTLDFQARMLGGFIDAAGARRVTLVLHDLGGPVGLLWAVRNPDRVERLVVMNTAVYRDGPARLFWAEGGLVRRLWSILSDREVSLASRLPIAAAHLPGLRRLVFSARGIATTMRMGVMRPRSAESVAADLRPFATSAARRVLRKTFLDPHLGELDEIVRNLHRLAAPALLLRASPDRLLPGAAGEMERLALDLPRARLEVLEGCGHFLPQDDPAEVARRIIPFLGGRSPPPPGPARRPRPEAGAAPPPAGCRRSPTTPHP